MKKLLFAWVLVVAAIVGTGSYLWFTEIPEAKPQEKVVSKNTPPQVLKSATITSGPIVIQMNKATEGDEDCLGSC